jgi:hypothetical protein
MKRLLNSTFVFRFDKAATLTSPLGLRRTPTANWRVWGSYVFRPMASGFVFLLLINLVLIPQSKAYDLNAKQIDWVLVAYNHFNQNLYQSQCYVELIMRESSFNPRARNGSHYGLAQMRNVMAKDMTPRQQVRMHMRYLDHRYDGSACKALQHLKNKGWH